MNFPIEIITDVPMWYNWIGNIGAIAILFAGISYTVVYKDYDSKEQEYGYTLLGVIVTTLIAVSWAAGWGIIVIVVIPGTIIYAIRRGYWGIKDWYFYRKYDQ